MGSTIMSRFDVYAPLNEFEWTGDDIELSPGLWIRRPNERPDLRGLNDTLATDEQESVYMTDHWLEFQWDEGTTPSAAELVNLTLLALWLTKPTKAHVAYRFELESGSQARLKSVCRILDRFAWVPGSTHSSLDDTDLQSAANYLPILVDLCRAKGRLNNALALTLAGCWSHSWQVALICHAAAAEAILTYSTRSGITKRLSISYACLTEFQSTDRDRAFREFANLYNFRSDIMHGRTHNIPTVQRLPILARFGDILRNLWCVVISSPSLIQTLEGTDSHRQAWFTAQEVGYHPPRL